MPGYLFKLGNEETKVLDQLDLLDVNIYFLISQNLSSTWSLVHVFHQRHVRKPRAAGRSTTLLCLRGLHYFCKPVMSLCVKVSLQLRVKKGHPPCLLRFNFLSKVVNSSAVSWGAGIRLKFQPQQSHKWPLWKQKQTGLMGRGKSRELGYVQNSVKNDSRFHKVQHRLGGVWGVGLGVTEQHQSLQEQRDVTTSLSWLTRW